MPQRSSIEKIRAELTWVTEPVDAHVCGCRTAQCCKEQGHVVGKCSRAPVTKLWTFRWEYFCEECREYAWGGNRVSGSMTAK
jgi:hypothetical protein